MRLDRLLNSLSSAPHSAQLRGSRKAILLRCLAFLLAALVSILYKFSFVTVNAEGMLAIPKGDTYYNYNSDGYPDADTSYTEIGESDMPREYNYALGDGVPSTILSANLIDFIAVNNGSVIVVSDPGMAFERRQTTDLIIGPKAWIVGHPLASQRQAGNEGIYDYRVTVDMRYCYGYISWSNSVTYGHFAIEEPTDI
ncbi:hypothetical protein F25303_14155 [Fusarium sp. NRRL 25303]|nr:hypothetical protein F25303_14155 [Fusarium sp. NRRL 25303]